MLRDNGSDSYHSYWCYEGTHWPAFVGSGNSSEARLAARRLWRLGRWSCLHPSRGHNSILTRIQRSNLILSKEVDVMRPSFNLKPKYRVTMLTTEKWTREPGTPAEMGPRR